MATECKSCGVAIRWVRSAARGKMMPIETQPDPDGRVWLDLMQAAHVVGPLGSFPVGIKVRYVAHFATCPGANAHRKSKDDRSVPDGDASEPPGLNAASRPAPKKSAAVPPAAQGDLFGKGKT